ACSTNGTDRRDGRLTVYFLAAGGRLTFSAFVTASEKATIDASSIPWLTTSTATPASSASTLILSFCIESCINAPRRQAPLSGDTSLPLAAASLSHVSTYLSVRSGRPPKLLSIRSVVTPTHRFGAFALRGFQSGSSHSSVHAGCDLSGLPSI